MLSSTISPHGIIPSLLTLPSTVNNSVMMPFIAFFSTILIGWIVTPDYVIYEMERSGDKFRRKKKTIMMFILFLQSTGILH